MNKAFKNKKLAFRKTAYWKIYIENMFELSMSELRAEFKEAQRKGRERRADNYDLGA